MQGPAPAEPASERFSEEGTTPLSRSHELDLGFCHHDRKPEATARRGSPWLGPKDPSVPPEDGDAPASGQMTLMVSCRRRQKARGCVSPAWPRRSPPPQYTGQPSRPARCAAGTVLCRPGAWSALCPALLRHEALWPAGPCPLRPRWQVARVGTSTVKAGGSEAASRGRGLGARSRPGQTSPLLFLADQGFAPEKHVSLCGKFSNGNIVTCS